MKIAPNKPKFTYVVCCGDPVYREWLYAWGRNPRNCKRLKTRKDLLGLRPADDVELVTISGWDYFCSVEFREDVERLIYEFKNSVKQRC